MHIKWTHQVHQNRGSFRNVQGPISYIVFSTERRPAFVVGDSIELPRIDAVLYMKTIILRGLSFERYDNAPYENNLLDIELYATRNLQIF